MENASKALIIAGAILIAIVLISIGISVLRSTGGIREVAGTVMTAQEKEIFNATFTGYSGINKASDIKALMTKVQSNNGANELMQIDSN